MKIIYGDVAANLHLLTLLSVRRCNIGRLVPLSRCPLAGSSSNAHVFGGPRRILRLLAVFAAGIAIVKYLPKPEAAQLTAQVNQHIHHEAIRYLSVSSAAALTTVVPSADNAVCNTRDVCPVSSVTCK